MTDWQVYRKTQATEMRPYVEGESTVGVRILAADMATGSPKAGDMIARNPQDHADQWLVSAEGFRANYVMRGD